MDCLTDCLMGCLMVVSIVLHKIVHQKKIGTNRGQGVSTVYEDIKETIAIIVDLQKVYVMDCLMVGSKVFAKESSS